MTHIQNALTSSALTCYNLHYAYYRILEIKARSESGLCVIESICQASKLYISCKSISSLLPI